jgi:uncharacterized protein YuzE
MKLKVDQNADALYFDLTDAAPWRSEVVAPGIIVDYDAQDRVVGIEVLYLSKHASKTEIYRMLFEFVPQPN